MPNSKDDTASPAVETPSESGISESGKPFTPDGTGTVVDNATNADGKEFFTVETPDVSPDFQSQLHPYVHLPEGFGRF
ncbi:hypothetical protein FACS18949_05440 [Clostridia bacterium]|nr:hypothetical protein FACS18949_05440 [Clostridia bacterium]